MFYPIYGFTSLILGQHRYRPYFSFPVLKLGRPHFAFCIVFFLSFSMLFLLGLSFYLISVCLYICFARTLNFVLGLSLYVAVCVNCLHCSIMWSVFLCIGYSIILLTSVCLSAILFCLSLSSQVCLPYY